MLETSGGEFPIEKIEAIIQRVCFWVLKSHRNRLSSPCHPPFPVRLGGLTHSGMNIEYTKALIDSDIWCDMALKELSRLDEPFKFTGMFGHFSPQSLSDNIRIPTLRWWACVCACIILGCEDRWYSSVQFCFTILGACSAVLKHSGVEFTCTILAFLV